MVRRAIFLTLAAAIAVAVVVFYDPGKPVPVIGPNSAWRLTFSGGRSGEVEQAGLVRHRPQ
ncbi:MAG: hypothetical protein O3C21_03755 [Verrucomicrobia bacterium]|nr:hypothetical protein [Verrucomicrobiota bacterium]